MYDPPPVATSQTVAASHTKYSWVELGLSEDSSGSVFGHSVVLMPVEAILAYLNGPILDGPEPPVTLTTVGEG
jgi:hypothetical protein